MKLKRFGHILEYFDDSDFDFEENPKKTETEEDNIYKEIFKKNPYYGFGHKDDEKNVSYKIKSLDEYTDEEKIRKFDQLYHIAIDAYNNRHDARDDDEYYIWEELMRTILGNNIFKLWNMD